MPHSVLILSPDLTLREQLESILGGTDYRIDIAPDWPLARRRISFHAPQTMLLDVRLLHQAPECCNCLEALAQGPLPIPRLLTLGGSFLPRRAANLVELLEIGNLAYPFEQDQWDDAISRHEGTGVPACCVIEADGLCLATYTPTLFPVMEQLRRIAGHDVPLALVGEMGTGKKTFARLIHHLSDRREGPFQFLSCGTVTPGSLEAELFGQVRGGEASSVKAGRVEAAAGGTLFLDEFDLLNASEQARLLRVLETGEFEPVGSTETRCATARLIVASKRDLATLVREHSFRTDLYYRLNEFEFHLPPLRDRPLDIVPLALEFIDGSSRQHGIVVHRIHRQFLAALKQYRWPFVNV